MRWESSLVWLYIFPQTIFCKSSMNNIHWTFIYFVSCSFVQIAMEALDTLLVTCHAQSLNLFVESFLKMVQKLLECNEPDLQIMATTSVCLGLPFAFFNDLASLINFHSVIKWTIFDVCSCSLLTSFIWSYFVNIHNKNDVSF